MFEKIKKDKKNIPIFNLSIIVFSWVLFFVFPFFIIGDVEVFLNLVSRSSIFSWPYLKLAEYLILIPFLFSVISSFLVVSQTPHDKKNGL
jgi:hypothetical protein